MSETFAQNSQKTKVIRWKTARVASAAEREGLSISKVKRRMFKVEKIALTRYFDHTQMTQNKPAGGLS